MAIGDSAAALKLLDPLGLIETTSRRAGSYLTGLSGAGRCCMRRTG